MQPALIIFSGMAGTGKTTLARLLCQRLQLPLVSFDHFVDYSWPRRLLEVEVLSDDEFTHILFSTAELQLSLGVSVVMDAIFGSQWRGLARELAARRQARLCAIHTFCSDEATWRQRVIGRAETALANETPAEWESVLASRSRFQPWEPGSALFVDAVQPVEENLARVLVYVQGGG